MAENAAPALPETLTTLELGAIGRIPAVRQLLLLIGVAAAVAAGFAAFLWAQGPDYRPVYQGLDGKDVAEVVASLNAAGIDNRVTTDGAGVMVPNTDMSRARLELAGQGLPGGSFDGMASLDEQSTFGVSQFMESARYQHALEAELARTIGNIRAVQEARVHLAVPKQTSFIRSRDLPSASVMVTLHRAQRLEAGQATSIVNLVAASVPNLTASAVTVVDQQGNLLSDRSSDKQAGRHNYQFEATRDLEALYRQRVIDLLAPVVGSERVRAEVVADLDFTVTEQTRESFDPAQTVVRSEAVNETVNTRVGPDGVGIPGALSNQPVETGGTINGVEVDEDGTPLNRQSSATRNFEIDKTVSVTREPTGQIRRLSVAVLIDNTPVVSPGDADGPAGAGDADDDASTSAEPIVNDEDIAKLTTLIREAIGYNEARGDSVSVVAAEFLPRQPASEIEPLPLWRQPDIVALARTVLGILLVAGIAFGVGRPFLRSLLATTVVATDTRSNASLAEPATGEVLPAGTPIPTAGAAFPAAPEFSYDQKIAAARSITNHDPARVAQVLKKWVANDE
ncbi:MAG: flagellar basal-body MS-ring/collar protein FliF [Pseudomonadota bacterium]